MKNKVAKTKQVIDYIESGKPLTKLECFEMFKLWNLGHVVNLLRKLHGYDYITTDRESNLTGTHAKYRLTNVNHLKS